ncbi:replication endonuclease [Hydrogenovibrio marinus]|uniref:Replication gene A protein-like domain-containing protein n=1 Tax=Hydrogenovibrio marinus TaxID=28885 RepID=A0A066ZTR1_HYDMR|nr:replication endonuclease [Hydrogenovibrio marinus]KDN95659.1 hypothetical protein EI16_04995 [Hydrogenovibrio marinus]BBN58862.1 hypothetical protein HVMH_0456 [Hydrogenovibrio marinus]
MISGNTIDLLPVISDDRNFVKEKLSKFPVPIQKIIFSEYRKKPTRRDANLFLLEIEERISGKLSVKPKNLKLNYNEDSLRELANNRAEICSRYVNANPQRNVNETFEYLTNYAKEYGVSVNVNERKEANIKRLCDPIWWLRKLRKSQVRNVETIHQLLNQISRTKQIYSSDWVVKKRRFQNLRHERSMSSTFLTNELGQTFSLKQLSDKSISNPKIRKAELMVRTRGFEECAKVEGHKALFLTLTCPSKYHSAFSKSGDPNPKWAGHTPLEAQNYLNNIWQRIRAKLDREGIRIYGFRVAEPNHDGTPHWHLLIFVNVNESKALVEIFHHYALLEDPEEKGAKEHRLTVTKIDPTKGSATGYIAKYISKNIDGSDLEEGFYGENPIVAAERVNAWAACWGIRQFQQLGGPSVSVWREARRLKDKPLNINDNVNVTLHNITGSAVNSNWRDFVNVMGGVFVKRKDQAARALYKFEVDYDTGEISQRYFDEEPIRKLKGFTVGKEEVITRNLKWKKEAFQRKDSFNLEFYQ